MLKAAGKQLSNGSSKQRAIEMSQFKIGRGIEKQCKMQFLGYPVQVLALEVLATKEITSSGSQRI